MRLSAMKSGTIRTVVSCFTLLAVVACSAPEGDSDSPADSGTKPATEDAVSPMRPASEEPRDPTDEAIEEAFNLLSANKRAIAESWSDRTFADFEAETYREADTGIYIVNGDVPIGDIKHLEEFFDKHVKIAAPDERGLIVNQAGGVDTVWTDTEKRNLSYCVSDAFGSNHAEVVNTMAAAAGAWEAAGDIRFIYSSGQDSSCTAFNNQVLFDVRPVSGQRYLARAFFPDDPRNRRNVLINSSALSLGPGNLSLTGILRHELGHTLGFRHEHTRPEAGDCFEDTNWRPLTDYDAFSTMHYPQCNGAGDWSLTLTAMDRSGIACLYGPAAGFTIDTNICEPPTPVQPACGPITDLESGDVGLHEIDRFGPYSVAQGTELNVTMSGTGDPDLYVRFRFAPSETLYDCRPYLSGPTESCDLTVPAGATEAHVMVRGYAAGTYSLTVEHVPSP